MMSAYCLYIVKGELLVMNFVNKRGNVCVQSVVKARTFIKCVNVFSYMHFRLLSGEAYLRDEATKYACVLYKETVTLVNSQTT